MLYTSCGISIVFTRSNQGCKYWYIYSSLKYVNQSVDTGTQVNEYIDNSVYTLPL